MQHLKRVQTSLWVAEWKRLAQIADLREMTLADAVRDAILDWIVAHEAAPRTRRKSR